MIFLGVALLQSLHFAVALQDYTFEDYTKAFGKEYLDEAEHAMRRSLFEERAREVAAQNARPGSSWVAGFNDLTDATPEELRSLLGYNQALRGFGEDILEGAESRSLAEHGRRRRRQKLGLPKSVDWRRSVPAVVTPVKRQGGCGSCWAFAAAETIESHTAISTGILTSLSPEELIDCIPNSRQCGGSGGCSGAVVQLAYNYTISAGGLAGIWNYPYQSGFGESPACQNGSDRTFRTPRRASITGYRDLPQNDAEALMEAVARKGPIAVSVDATDWWMYQQGIFDSCNHSAPNINHAVVLDGYGTENGTDYWLVRNSWGFEFGEAGYIRLRRYDVEPCGEDPAPLSALKKYGFACKVGGPHEVTACGECGVLSDSSYPTGAKTGPMDGFEYRPSPAPEGYGNGEGYGNDDSNSSSSSTDTDDNSSNVSRSSSDVNNTDNLPRRLSLTSQSNAASTLPSKTQEEVPEILSASVHV